MKLWPTDLTELVYPIACAGCSKPLIFQEKVFCLACLSELPQTDFHHSNENPVQQLFMGRLQLEKAAAFLYFSKGSSVQQAMHQFKYKGVSAIGHYWGQLMATELQAQGFFEGIDVLIPVPLHSKKEKKRGYNQALILAEGVASITDIPISTNNLVREVFSKSQTRMGRFARWKNVEPIFKALEPSKFSGMHVLLIDDVVTTGATIEACAQELLPAPDIRISLLTLAIA